MTMDMTAEAMQKTLDIAKPEVVEVTDALGFTTRYSTKPIFEVKAKALDLPEDVGVFTLSGLAQLVREQLENADFGAEFMIHVENETSVAIKPRVADPYGRRQRLVVAQPVPFTQFKFGQWINQEEFAISVAALFAETEDKAHVLKLASTLTNEGSSTTEDDGFTQRATVRAGLALKQNVTIKPRVALAPFRTFPEVEQPVSEFVFRARCADGATPQLMLVEADGGRWKVDAINTIQKELLSFELGVPIIA